MTVDRTGEIAIQARGLRKKFCRSLHRSLRYGIADIFGEFACREDDRLELREAEFWALDGIDLTVRMGEVVGLIGSNGAGKSTLLKLIHGLIRPDGGEIQVNGQVRALIELGAGFDPVLTGRENVYVNGAILGLKKAEVDELWDDIESFADIGDFIDAPVQGYSSGMRARLGFAVMAQLEPDVMLIDEVLAVGDMAFQEKCMRRIDTLRQSDKAIVFVTHSLYQVEALCSKALWLDRGRVVQFGPAGDVVRAYLDRQERAAIAEAADKGERFSGVATDATRAYLDARDEANAAEEEQEAQGDTGAGVTASGESLEIIGAEVVGGERRSAG